MMDCFCPAPRSLACRVVLLDERELLHEIQDNSTGQALLDVVFRHLDLLETAYFGLRYVDQDNQTHWLDVGKRLRRQLRGADPHTFYFGVKFYATDPCKLLEEITRYQLFLQVKQDVLRGRLPVNFELAAELAAYVLQSELGDYEGRRHGPGYVSEFRLLANQTAELESRAAEVHRTLTGVSPAQAELSYLDKVKWLDMYGVDLHPVLGEDSVEYFLGLAPSGLLLLRGKHAVANYYWPRVSKLYYKGRYFMLRVADKNNDASTYGFESPSRAACRHLWRCCSDHHAFFRLQQVSPAGADIFALGSRFSGRSVRPRPPPAFTRTPSRRHARASHASHNSIHDVPKMDDVRQTDCPEMKQPTSVQRPNSVIGDGGMGCGGSVGAPGGSPRSTRSAPIRRGLYTATPPSARPPPAPRGRSASVDSQSSNDSRSTRKHKHRSRRQSDAESELSRGSGRSARRHRRHRSRHKRDSGSERDDRHADTAKEYELVDSELQWREVQRQAAAAGTGVQVASVRRSQVEPDTGTHRSSHRHRRHRKHRSRSGSPSDKKWLPSELKQHLEFKLVDTAGMSEDQLKEIPYTVVQTSQARQTKLRQSARHKQSEKVPLSHIPSLPVPHKSINDIINNQGSIGSGSSTLSSARTGSDKLNSRFQEIVGLSDSGACDDIIKGYPNYSDPHSSARGDDYITSNGTYQNNNPIHTHSNTSYSNNNNNSNSNSSSGELIASSARVSHEHTDSGLGADQDYAYSSERAASDILCRSSDSAKCPAASGGRGRLAGPAAGASAAAPVSSGRLHSVSVCGDLAELCAARATRKPPAAPGPGVHRARAPAAGGSLRSLVSVASVASEGRATSRRARPPPASRLSTTHLPPLYHPRADSGFSFHRHASNNNFIEALGSRGRQDGGGRRDGGAWWPERPAPAARTDNNANLTRTHSRPSRHDSRKSRHDNTLNIILKPLIESTQMQGN